MESEAASVIFSYFLEKETRKLTSARQRSMTHGSFGSKPFLMFDSVHLHSCFQWICFVCFGRVIHLSPWKKGLANETSQTSGKNMTETRFCQLLDLPRDLSISDTFASSVCFWNVSLPLLTSSVVRQIILSTLQKCHSARGSIDIFII